jgi:hypothetical protein
MQRKEEPAPKKGAFATGGGGGGGGGGGAEAAAAAAAKEAEKAAAKEAKAGRGRVQLIAVVRVQCPSEDPEVDSKLHSFDLVCEDRVWTLHANTVMEKQMWLMHLRSVMERESAKLRWAVLGQTVRGFSPEQLEEVAVNLEASRSASDGWLMWFLRLRGPQRLLRAMRRKVPALLPLYLLPLYLLPLDLLPLSCAPALSPARRGPCKLLPPALRLSNGSLTAL